MADARRSRANDAQRHWRWIPRSPSPPRSGSGEDKCNQSPVRRKTRERERSERARDWIPSRRAPRSAGEPKKQSVAIWCVPSSRGAPPEAGRQAAKSQPVTPGRTEATAAIQPALWQARRRCKMTELSALRLWSFAWRANPSPRGQPKKQPDANGNRTGS